MASAAFVKSLVVGTGNSVTVAQQLAGSVTVTGTVDAPLAGGEAVEIVLPDGEVAQATATPDGLGFSFTASLLLAEIFGVSGTVSAYVLNTQRVKGPVITQSYVADSQRSIALVTATPDDLTASGLGQLAVSGDGKSVAFDAYPTGMEAAGDSLAPVQAGLYSENLQTQAITLLDPGGSEASQSNDGKEVAYAISDNTGVQIHVKSLVTGLDLLISATARSEGTVGADGISDRPSLSADGQTVAFESNATDLTIAGSTGGNQIYVAQGLSDVASVTLVSAPASGAAEGDGDSLNPSLSADGTTVVFASTSNNLLAAGSLYAGKFDGTYEIYAKALANNAATGQLAGEVTLVSGLADGTVANGESLYPVVSGNGRYVVFQSSADNLVPGVTVPGEADEIYVKDLLTGAIRLVSESTDGAVADQGAASATISADGRTVVFESTATNLLPAGADGPNAAASAQLYAKDLVTGTLTLLSAAGYTPGNADSGGVSSLSSDGSVVAFTSDASNLVPATNTASPGSFHGYVTAVQTTPLLTIQAPAASTTASSAVFTGTVDAADSGQAIIVTDTTDPGFAPVMATVTPTSDATVYSWTATVGLTIPGSQTVSATIDGVSGAVSSVTASIVYAATQSVTIDPVGVNGALTAAALVAGGSTVVTGTAGAAAGQTLQLSLQQAGGPLLPLGTAVVAADGSWSVSVANDTLTANPSGAYALVAQVTDAQGDAQRGTQAVSLTVPVPTTLYDIDFTYPDGSFYLATVAAAGSAYQPGQTIQSVAGHYTVLAAAGTTTQPVGSVTTSRYFDVSTDAIYATSATGVNGLGSETGLVNGVEFGGGAFEAKLAPTTLYDFYFKYIDGSYYYGTVAADGALFSYYTGEAIVTPYGNYFVYGSAGATTQTTGTVYVTSYYDVFSGQSYVPVGFAGGKAAGNQGLFSELDQTDGPLKLQTFGKGGLYEAEQESGYVYKYYFRYTDGSYYYGTVVGGSAFKYFVGDSQPTAYGYYYIYAQGDVTTTPSGSVTTNSYYDISAGAFFTPTSAGTISGTSGLGSELDHTTGPQGTQAFGERGLLEAYQAPSVIYKFYFRYTDGSYYYGTVDSGVDYRYYTGYSLMTPYGYYYVYAPGAVTTEAGGTVHTTAYYDVSSGILFTPVDAANGVAAGSAGLGSELDHTSGDQGLQAFGQGGQLEAKQAPNQAYSFYFRYLDGSYYYGTAVQTPGGLYSVGFSLKTAYGYYHLYSEQASKDPAGTVRLSDYYDITTGQFYVPVQYAAGRVAGVAGIGSETDDTTGAQGLQAFGLGGSLEARQAATTLYSFYFRYTDGSYYYGKVAAGLTYLYHVGQSVNTANGEYYIYSSSGATSQVPGTVTTTSYYDTSTKQFFTPSNGGAGKPSGTEGLQSEIDYTTGAQGLLAFGYGGSYEARQGPSVLFDFRFTYPDGSYYTGTVAAGGRFDLFTVGETLSTAGGSYYIDANLGNTLQASGTTHAYQYYDSTTGAVYIATSFINGVADGTNGLLYELDSVTGPNGLRNFGQGGALEAKEGVASPFKLVTTAATLVFDGPIAGATIGYFDPAALPGIVQIDPTQPTAITDGDGRYALAAGSGTLVLTGGTDTATGLSFHGILEAPADASVLSPITTLITEVARQSGDLSTTGIAAAQTLVANALGLSPSIDFDNYAAASILQNPLATADDIGTAEPVFLAGARLLDVEALIDAAGGSSEAAIVSLASAIAAKTITAITDFSPLLLGSGLTADAADTVASITAANIAAVDAQLAGLTDPNLIFDVITGSSIAQQGDTARVLQAAGGSYAGFVDSYVQGLPALLATADLLALNPSPACYVDGTRILTDQGEVAVERLVIGDCVVTHDGRIAPIRWVGRRSYAGRFLKSNPKVQPIRFAAMSLGAGLPRRGLLVSPNHAMFLGGVLIPAWCLVNNVSIVQDCSRDRVDYNHIELDQHDLILAEGSASETFIDDDSRSLFHNAAEFCALYPHGPERRDVCAPRVEAGYMLEAIRQQLAMIADATLLHQAA